MSKSFEVRGVDGLLKQLHKNANLDDVKNVVRVNTTEMHRKATRNASFKGHYDSSGRFIRPTGATKRSIAIEFRDAGLTGVVKTGTHYSPYLEFGTRKMNAQPFMRPAFYDQRVKFMQDMSRLLKK